MSVITRQDTNGTKPLLQVGELGYDNFPAGGDSGRVYVGTGSVNIPLAKKVEMSAVDSKADVHIARVDNPHEVTKAQVGLGNVENLAPADMPISSAGHAALNAKANKTDADLLGVPKAPTADVGTNSTQLATTAFVGAEIADKAYSKTQLDAGQLDNRYYTETELDNGALDNRYYTESEIDAKLEAQNDASEINYDGTLSGLVATNVQNAIDEVENRLGISETAISNANLTRVDKYLASQNIAKMRYTNGDLTKIQYKNATDVDYEVFSYSGGDLSGIAHYVGGILKGNSVLLYTDGDLSSVVFTEV